MVFHQVVSSVRNFVYDLHITNTPSFYRFALQELILAGSVVLDVGIGNGSCIVSNKDLIESKNVTIDGIDIDSDYVALCSERIKEAQLVDKVTVRNQDMLTMDSCKKYDYIMFTESYPVIPTTVMCDMMTKSRELLNPGGKVIFIHNLENNYDYVRAFLKPLLKYVPGVWIDFGKLTTHAQFEQFLTNNRYQLDQKRLIQQVMLSTHWGMYLPSALDAQMNQFAIVVFPY